LWEEMIEVRIQQRKGWANPVENSMKHPENPIPKTAWQWRGIAGRLLLLVASFSFSCAGLEILLRLVPSALPHGVFYGSGSYDPELGFQLPTSKVFYNKARFVERTPNAHGLMDVDHVEAKVPGAARVGFFGDSYVESVQVPLEDVFFRRLPAILGGRPLETFGFGLSGLGTLHAMSLYEKFGQRYDLDLVVYVFVDNDPGDHLETMQRARRGLYAARPTAVPSAQGEGYEVVPGPTPGTASPLRRLAMLLKDHSLLARVVYARIQLLSRRGARDAPALKAQDPPSTWPPELRIEAETLTRRLLRTWAGDVRADGRKFLVFYVPRPKELESDLGADSWRGWLVQSCKDLDIALVDPTATFAARQRQGVPLYDDHWSLAGHAAVAEVLTDVLKDVLTDVLKTDFAAEP
jgi:hypothetical protein